MHKKLIMRAKRLAKRGLVLFGKVKHSVLDGFLNKNIGVFEMDGKHVFCGYYDLDPLKGDLLLVHVVDVNSEVGNSPADLGVFNIVNGKYENFSSTMAWCWQQGSRLRWSNREENEVYFNDYDEGGYCCKMFNIEKRRVIKKWDVPLYDISTDEKTGISVDFERLQKLRPGYGYNNERNFKIIEKAPKDDGLVLVDLETNERKLLISLRDLAIQGGDNEFIYNHYINHVSFSPDSRQVMFFHIWDERHSSFDWKTNLCIYDLRKKNCKVIEVMAVVSHYAWVNNNEIIITCYTEIGPEEYRLYDIKGGTYRLLKNKRLNSDGHPTMCGPMRFFSDTYPDRLSYQRLFWFDMETNESKEVKKFYADDKMTGEKRCDLHPKYNNSGVIFVDSTFRKGKRSVAMIRVKGKEK